LRRSELRAVFVGTRVSRTRRHYLLWCISCWPSLDIRFRQRGRRGKRTFEMRSSMLMTSEPVL
jgi:hypothetical protein